MFNRYCNTISFLTTQFLLMVSVTCFSQIPKLSSLPTAEATMYLDFDGHTVEGSIWNWEGPIHAQPAALSANVIEEIFKRVAEDYRIFELNITTDSSVFATAPFSKRERVIITPTSYWYGQPAGGTAMVNSFLWGDDTPVWVFSDFLFGDAKYIAETISHEVGHSLGLHHQSIYDENCELVTEYAEGSGEGETGWAPIMGKNYYKNITTWHVGTSIIGCDFIQNDIEVIVRNGIALREDDHADNMHSATFIPYQKQKFESWGIINNETDRDFFSINIQNASYIKIDAIPNNVGEGYSGANVDLELRLFRSDGQLVGVYNPIASLSASIDTHLIAGTYYISVDGVSNENLQDYGSMGYYTLTGSVEARFPVADLKLTGEVKHSEHLIKWNFSTDEPLRESTIEYSLDGKRFNPLQNISPTTDHFNYRPFVSGSIFYRIKLVTLMDNEEYYSNIIQLKSLLTKKITLFSNQVHSFLQLTITNGNFSYHILDETGRLLQKGRLTQGLNNVIINSNKSGILLLKVFNQQEQSVFRLIKQ